MTLEVLFGTALDGPHVTELADLGEGQARVGLLVAGPAGLLGDLELRLGVGPDTTPPPVRVASYARRLDAVARTHGGRLFWSASFAKDPLGTARAILAWRDELVLGGWSGGPIVNGGSRLEALAWVEAIGATEANPDVPVLPHGTCDRWVEVATLLEAGARVPYSRVRVVDSLALFSSRVRQVLRAFTRQGIFVAQVSGPITANKPTTDLGRLQQHLRHGGAGFVVHGDGSLLVVEAETATELAGATAALLARDRGRDVVVRLSDPAPLDYALRAAGLPTQGLASSSTLRPIFQVLPLVLELAYEPKDPHRVLELLTLHDGPFRGRLGHALARAFAGAPGLGNAAWEDEKRTSAKNANEAALLALVAGWIEARGATHRASTASLLARVAHVQAWLRERMIDDATALAAQAHVQARALSAALAADPRTELTLVEIRQLFAEALGGGLLVQLAEQAGRIDHVTDPAALLGARDTVVLWGATDGGAEQKKSPWTPRERSAIGAASITLSDPARALVARAEAGRRALLLATHRVVFARSLTHLGVETTPHPLLDELTARISGSLRPIVRTALALLDGDHAEPLAPLELPSARGEWAVPAALLTRRERLSPSSIETLIGCPLRFVLEKEAGLVEQSLVALPEDHNLFGSLGHALVERLHEQQLLGASAATGPLRTTAELTFDALVREQASLLLMPGRSHVRAQLRTRLVSAVLALDGLLRRSQLTVQSVEEDVEAAWDGRTVVGRIDLLLRDAAGNDVVLDLKWGHQTYADKLGDGVALQLATYAFARRTQTKAKVFPHAAYFSLREGEPLALSKDVIADAKVVDGPDLERTWTRTAASIVAVEEDLARGRIAVTGAGHDEPAWKSSARADRDPDGFLPLHPEVACGYCALGAVCGRRWVGP